MTDKDRKSISPGNSQTVTTPGERVRGAQVTREENRRDAVRLRRDGLTYAEIGAKLGISLSAAYKYVRAHVDMVRKEADEDATHVRTVELERLDRATELVMASIEAGELAAVDKLVKLSERRAKLLGLDAPVAVRVEDDDLTSVPTDALLRRLAAIDPTVRAAVSLSDEPAEPETEVH